jgi:hypothetical protein
MPFALAELSGLATRGDHGTAGEQPPSLTYTDQTLEALLPAITSRQTKSGAEANRNRSTTHYGRVNRSVQIARKAYSRHNDTETGAIWEMPGEPIMPRVTDFHEITLEDVPGGQTLLDLSIRIGSPSSISAAATAAARPAVFRSWTGFPVSRRQARSNRR